MGNLWKWWFHFLEKTHHVPGIMLNVLQILVYLNYTTNLYYLFYQRISFYLNYMQILFIFDLIKMI